MFGPGDEVITHAACWPTLTEQVKLADATPVLTRTHAEDGFSVHAQAMLDAVTAKTRGIIVNSPGNPTGALIAESELRAIGEMAAARGIWVIVDLCYEKLIYDDVPHNLPRVLAETCPDQTVLCGSASKAYAMTGWRCGWQLGPAAVIAASSAIQSHSTSNVTSITQKAAVAALIGSQTPVTAMLDEYRKRRDQLHAWLTADPRLRCRKPAGAFYMFVDVSDRALGRRFPHLARLCGRAAPGIARRGDAGRGLRRARARFALSYATSMEMLKEGSERLLAFVGQHARRRRRSAKAFAARLKPSRYKYNVQGGRRYRRVKQSQQVRESRRARGFRQQGYTVVRSILTKPRSRD